jgi:adenylate cyclase class 2
MTYEIETKILDIDADGIKKKLVELGAQKTRETILRVDWYRPKGTKEGEDAWFLRIRSDSEGKYEVTWKAKSDIVGIARKHKEINFIIPEPEKLADLFEELGLEKYAHQDKERTSFALKDWLFEIDRYPRMPSYLEIEGKNEEHINEAITLLGLEKNRTWATGERTLIQEIYGLNWYDMRF